MKVELYSLYNKQCEDYISYDEYNKLISLVDKGKNISLGNSHTIYFFDKDYINKDFLYGKISKKEFIENNITNEVKSGGAIIKDVELLHSTYFLIKSPTCILFLYNNKNNTHYNKFNDYLKSIDLNDLSLSFVVNQNKDLSNYIISKGTFKLKSHRGIPKEQLDKTLAGFNINHNGVFDSFKFELGVSKKTNINSILARIKNIFDNKINVDQTLTFNDENNNTVVLDLIKNKIITKYDININKKEITEEDLYFKMKSVDI